MESERKPEHGPSRTGTETTKTGTERQKGTGRGTRGARAGKKKRGQRTETETVTREKTGSGGNQRMENIPGILTGRKAEIQTSQRKRYGHEQDFLFFFQIYLFVIFMFLCVLE